MRRLSTLSATRVQETEIDGELSGVREEEIKNKKEVKVHEAGQKRRSRKKSKARGGYFDASKKRILTVEFGDSVPMLARLARNKGGRKCILRQGAQRTMCQ